MSLFTELLEEILGIDDVTDIEPEEIRILCEDPFFQKVCDYCYRSRHRGSGDSDDTRFTRAELGIDPEEDM